MSKRIETSIIVNSDPKSGSENLTSDGHMFEVHMRSPIQVDSKARNVTLEVPEATIWWTVPNIITGQNDTIRMIWEDQDNLGNFLDETVTIPQGLFSPSQLFQTINQLFETEHDAPSNLISPISNYATSILSIKLNYGNTTLKLSEPNSPTTILGFPAVDLVGGTDPTTFAGSDIARFNTVDHFLIHSDIISKGISINGRNNQTISQVSIDVQPGFQITARPFNPAKVDASNLKHSAPSILRFWLTDGDNRPVNTGGEYWSARLVLKYDL